MTRFNYLTYTWVILSANSPLTSTSSNATGRLVSTACVFSSPSLMFIFFFPNRTDQEIQTYTIAVINALFLKAPDDKRQVSCWDLLYNSRICKKSIF